MLDVPLASSEGMMRNISYSQKSSGTDEDKVVWFKSKLRVDDIPEASDFPPQYQYTVTGKKRLKKPGEQTTTQTTTQTQHGTELGRKVELNAQQIAVFKYRNRIYAVQDSCPHMGGPLHLGDIEEIDGQICVSCPVHRWSFDLDSGKCLVSDQVKMKCFEIKVTEREREIYVGFDGIQDEVFRSQDF